MTKKHTPPTIQNKKARHYYDLLEFIEAGIVLTGSEIKSIRAAQASFNDAYVSIQDGEAYLRGLTIAQYANAGYAQHEPDRERKLLLNKQEIRSLAEKIQQKGLTIVPVNLHFRNGKAKIELAVGRGKKLHDHRQSLKDATEMREAERAIRQFNR